MSKRVISTDNNIIFLRALKPCWMNIFEFSERTFGFIGVPRPGQPPLLRHITSGFRSMLYDGTNCQSLKRNNTENDVDDDAQQPLLPRPESLNRAYTQYMYIIYKPGAGTHQSS